ALMGSTQDQRPAIPALAERARTLAARGRTATVMAAGIASRVMPALHHVQRDDSALLLLARDHDLPTLVDLAPGSEVSAMVELTDIASVALREPVRGLLWITGWLRVLAPDQGRTLAMRWAEQRPDPHLLDVGHTASLLWLDPVFVVFSDAEGSGWLTPTALASAEPDPFCRLEHAWLRHLEQYHPEVLRAAVWHLAAGQHQWDTQVRPLGIDRLGVRLRIEGSNRAQDVRLAFHQQASTPVQLARELYGLLGRPAVAQKTR
ncbi:MAG: DUF2470 domain-containing protein, partial [Pseudonocardiaceae bacterium]